MMNSNNPFNEPGQDIGDFAESGGDSQPSPITYVLRELRGRYVLTAVLCATFAILFGAAGYLFTSPKYTSAGVVRIAPTRPVILYENELNESLDSFDSFVETQEVLIKSPRVLTAALEDEKLKASEWPGRPEGVDLLSKLLTVHHARRSEVIHVSVTHADRKLAEISVNAVLDAYMKIARDKAAQEFGNREQELVALRDEYEREYESARDQAFRLAESSGTSDLVSDLEAKRNELARLNTLVNSLELSTSVISNREIATAEEAAENPIKETIEAMDEQDLARYDAELAELVDRRDQMELRRDTLRSSGMKSQHREMKRLISDLNTVERYVLAQMEVTRAALLRDGLPVENTGGGENEAYTARQNLQRLESARELRDELSQEVIRLGRAQVRINYYEDRAAEFAKRRENAEKRLETFRVEGRTADIGRMELWQRASTPTSPSVDRRKPLAMLGAMGGGGLGMAIVLGLAFVRPKYRHVEDISTGTNDYILGMLPDLNLEIEGIDEMATASIHRIRGILDAQSKPAEGRGSVHTVVSATAGEGKTNLAFGLASSFAKTGKRTLLIDADLIAPSVSSELGLLQDEGLAQAIESGSVNGAIQATPTPNFFVLPAGVMPDEQNTSEIADTLSRHNMRKVLDELTPQFDEIILDTGPLLGSIESVASAAVADGVIFVVGRGQHPTRVRAALRHLRMLGVERVGLVFNRASLSDLSKSSLSVLSHRSMSVMRDHGSIVTPGRKLVQSAIDKREKAG